MESLDATSGRLRTLYLVQRFQWCYDDEWHKPIQAEPIRAFANREAAEAYRRTLEIDARSDYTEEGDEYGFVLLPNKDQDFEVRFFEVLEVSVWSE